MSNLPATVSSLDLAVVVEVLARHACNVTDAAATLGDRSMWPPSTISNTRQRRRNDKGEELPPADVVAEQLHARLVLPVALENTTTRRSRSRGCGDDRGRHRHK